MSSSDTPAHPALPTLDHACGKAIELQLAGQVDAAEQLYRAILVAEPQHAAANHCLGMLKVQVRRPADGLPFLLSAVEAQPQSPDYWLGYLEALLLAGEIDLAADMLALARGHGLSGETADDFAHRLDAVRPRIAIEPPAAQMPARADPSKATLPSASVPRRGRPPVRPAAKQERALLNLLKLGRLEEATVHARAMTKRYPEHGLGWKTLGALLFLRGDHEEALTGMEAAARLLPQDAETLNNLGMALCRLKRLDESESYLKQALAIEPDLASAHYNLAVTQDAQGCLDEAEASARSALALSPEYAKAYDALASVLYQKGQHELAVKCSRRALEIDPEIESFHTNLLFILSHSGTLDADELFAEHCRVGERFEDLLRASWPQHANLRDPERCLRVGIVSGDLCGHPVANFVEPLLAHLRTSSGLELHAYYTNPIEDGATRRLRDYFRHWHAVSALPQPALARKITEDAIDILIDLSGHTTHNRLRTFAHKPAPLQVSWIGYPGTTGLRAMDYYLTDASFMPPGQFDSQFTEKLVYLPAVAPFQPFENAPPVNRLPALDNGFFTFGSFNRLSKVNESTIAAWARLLRAAPTSRMTLGGLPDDASRERLVAQFAAKGICSSRLTFHARAGMEHYLALHHLIDLCLDTQPYTGGTTTNHALWMGVPTLTLAGPTPAARQGAANLGSLGLHGFIAADPEDFLRKGLYWVEHVHELADVRAGMRERWHSAPNRQPEVIARALERGLRQMWARWCGGFPTVSFIA